VQSTELLEQAKMSVRLVTTLYAAIRLFIIHCGSKPVNTQ